MDKELCTIYDCEWDLYYKGVIQDNVVCVLDNEGNPDIASEYICEYIDFDMVQFYIGYYDEMTNSKKDKSKWGYFRLSTGRVVVPPIYNHTNPFYGDRAKVQKDKKYGFVDPEGIEVVKTIWSDAAGAFYTEICWVKEGDKFGYIDKFGAVVLPPQFEDAKQFRSIGKAYEKNKYVALVKKDGKYGYIDGKSDYIFEPSFEDAKEFCSRGYAPVMTHEKWSFIDGNGEFVVAFQFDDVGESGMVHTNENLNKEKASNKTEYIHFYTVRKHRQWGLMNDDFEIIMPLDVQNYVVYIGNKIYITDGRVTSIRKVKV